jgi:hypothetical protein
MSLPQFTEESILNLDKMHPDYRKSEIQKLIGEVFDTINHAWYRTIKLMVRKFSPRYNIETGVKSDRSMLDRSINIGDINLNKHDVLISSNIEQNLWYQEIASDLILQSYHSTWSKKLIKQITWDYNIIKGSIIFSHIYPISQTLVGLWLDPSINIKDTELYIFQGIKETK